MCSVCALNTEVFVCQLAPSKAAGIFSTLMYSCSHVKRSILKALKKAVSDSFNYNCQKQGDIKFQLATNGRVLFCFAFKHFKTNLLKVGGKALIYALRVGVREDGTSLAEQVCWEAWKVGANNISLLRQFHSGFYVFCVVTSSRNKTYCTQEFLCLVKSYFECLKPSNTWSILQFLFQFQTYFLLLWRGGNFVTVIK